MGGNVIFMPPCLFCVESLMIYTYVLECMEIYDPAAHGQSIARYPKHTLPCADLAAREQKIGSSHERKRHFYAALFVLCGKT
jgi:hypothetical protein